MSAQHLPNGQKGQSRAQKSGLLLSGHARSQSQGGQLIGPNCKRVCPQHVYMQYIHMYMLGCVVQLYHQPSKSGAHVEVLF